VTSAPPDRIRAGREVRQPALRLDVDVDALGELRGVLRKEVQGFERDVLCEHLVDLLDVELVEDLGKLPSHLLEGHSFLVSGRGVPLHSTSGRVGRFNIELAHDAFGDDHPRRPCWTAIRS
jgi:hypothetical protein